MKKRAIGLSGIVLLLSVLCAGQATIVQQQVTSGGTNIFTGLDTFSNITLAKQGLNPTTGVPQLSGGNTLVNAQQVGFPTESPLFYQFLENNSNIFYANPQIYLSRNDQTPYTTPGGTPGIGSCLNTGPMASCDQPMVLIAGTNQNTGNIPGMVGVEVNLWGFKANGASPPIFANYEAAFGANVSDTVTDNITNLRGANLVVNTFGLPTHTGPGGFTRSADGLEIDIANNTGADSTFGVSGGTGNYLLGESLISTGANNNAEGLEINSSSSSGKGWLDGIQMGGIVNCGVCIYKGGPGSFSPTIGIQLATGGTYGLVVGAGTITTPLDSASNSNANPTNGIVLDAIGTAGNSETVNSEAITFRAKNAATSGTDWQIQHIAGSSLQFTLIGAASYFKFSNTGHLIFSGAASQHIDTFAANNDIAGKLTCATSTIAKTFSTAYTSTPVVVVFDETTKGGANLTAISNTGFTVSCTGATDALDYAVYGNPN